MGIESQGTKLEIEGAGSLTPITTMTAAVGYPTILTKASHGLKNGDVGVLSAFAGADAALMNGKTVIVKNVTDDTFAVNIDTTGKTLTPDLGTITPQSWVEIGEVVDWGGPTGTASIIDMTNLQSVAKIKRMGLPDEGKFTLAINFQPDEVGQLAVRAARTARAEKSFRITYSDLSTATFSGYVLGFTTSGSVDGKVAGSIDIEISGAVE